jgi:hypothetical protein
LKAEELIRELKRKFSITTDRALAAKLGMTEIALGNWKREKRPLTARQISNAIDKSGRTAVAKAHRQTIRPVVEFFPLDAVESRGGVRNELFPAKDGDSPQHIQLREALRSARGNFPAHIRKAKAAKEICAKAQRARRVCQRV